MSLPVTPRLTVDAVIFDDENEMILLVERRNTPLGWALPGGFVDVGETVQQALLRETNEETGLTVVDLMMFGVYSSPARDLRGHIVSLVFYVNKYVGAPVAGDDAGTVSWFKFHQLPELAFDHKKIIGDFESFLQNRAGIPYIE